MKRADRGDAGALAEVRRVYDAVPELWREAGDLAKQAELAWLKTTLGAQRTAREATERMAAELRRQIAGEDPPPLERLLAERAVVCWLQLNYVGSILAQRLGGDGLTRGQISMYQEWLDRAEALPGGPQDAGPGAQAAHAGGTGKYRQGTDQRRLCVEHWWRRESLTTKLPRGWHLRSRGADGRPSAGARACDGRG